MNSFLGWFLPGQVGLEVAQQSLSLFLYKLLPLWEEGSEHHLEDDLGAGGEGRDEDDQEEELQKEIEWKKVQQEVQQQLGDWENTEDSPVLQPLAIVLKAKYFTIYQKWLRSSPRWPRFWSTWNKQMTGRETGGFWLLSKGRSSWYQEPSRETAHHHTGMWQQPSAGSGFHYQTLPGFLLSIFQHY